MKTIPVKLNLFEKGDVVILPLDLQNQFQCNEATIIETEWLVGQFEELSKDPKFDVFNVRRMVLVTVPSDNPAFGPISVSAWVLRIKQSPNTYTLS